MSTIGRTGYAFDAARPCGDAFPIAAVSVDTVASTSAAATVISPDGRV
jgi:hypothetical protein